jgi:ABC-2 type transport system ATP-binding protein
MITIKNLSKSYGSNQVLKDINLNLHKGNVYGFVGENGSGKTTLFRCIADFENYRGNIISDYKILKNHLGFLQTYPFFMSRITGWEYLKLLSIARNIKTENFKEKNIFKLPLNQYTDTYSTGMIKKLALMGILLQQNDIYILDEPFNGVDIHSNILISEIIAKLKSLNKIILISSHIFSTLSVCSDEIRLLKNGSFNKTVKKGEFIQLENEMKRFVVGNRIEKLALK